MESPLRDRRWEGAAWILAAATFVYYFALLEHQYLAIRTSNEVPAFEDLFWNALRGHGLRAAPGEPSFLGHHFSPILWLLVPLYAIGTSVHSLLGVHALAAALTVHPLFALTRSRLGSSGAALAVAACIPLSRVMNYGVMVGFHMEVFYPALALYAVGAAERGRWRWFAGLVVAYLMVKEDAAVPMAGLGVYLWLRGWRKAGVLTAAGAVAWLGAVLLVIIPAFRAQYPDREWEFVRYWSAYGEGLGEVARNMLDPRVHAGVLFTPEKLAKSFNVFSVFLFLPFLSWRALVALVLPSWFILYSSDQPQLWGLGTYYGFAITPFLFVAALDGLGTLQRWVRWPRLVPVVVGLWFVVNLGNARVWKHLSPGYWEVPARTATARRLVEHIPPDGRVAAQFHLLAILPPSTHRRLLPEPRYVADAEWAFFDLEGNCYPATPEENRAALAGMRTSGDWETVAEADGYVVLRRSEG